MARYQVKVIPSAKADRIVQETGRLKVYLRAPAEKGRANRALIDILAEHFEVKSSRISIIKGMTSREKTVEIDFNA